jgi:hypothetical protein
MELIKIIKKTRKSNRYRKEKQIDKKDIPRISATVDNPHQAEVLKLQLSHNAMKQLEKKAKDADEEVKELKRRS